MYVRSTNKEAEIACQNAVEHAFVSRCTRKQKIINPLDRRFKATAEKVIENGKEKADSHRRRS